MASACNSLSIWFHFFFQPKSAAAAGRSSEEIIEETTKEILAKIPQKIDLKAVMAKYPLMYEESMNTVLSQEIMRQVESFCRWMP
jgi:hypothetical protein